MRRSSWPRPKSARRGPLATENDYNGALLFLAPRLLYMNGATVVSTAAGPLVKDWDLGMNLGCQQTQAKASSQQD